MFRRLWEKIKLLWKLAKSERASPREIGWAVAIGAFAGCTPAVGFHGPLALFMATLCRKNRLFSWLGSRISNMIFLPFIALAEVQLAHRVRTGAWLEVDRHDALKRAGELLLDWCLGTIPVGIVIGALMGVMAWGLAHRRDRRRAMLMTDTGTDTGTDTDPGTGATRGAEDGEIAEPGPPPSDRAPSNP